MTVAKSYFDLQLAFCHKVTSLTGLPAERVVFDYTNFYIRFGLGRRLDSSNAEWQRYLSGFRRATDPEEWTFRFYMENPEAATAPQVEATFGCFSYALRGSSAIKLHFRDAEPAGSSPLGLDRMDRRRQDLRELFQHVRQAHPGRTTVLGASWLYNIEAYRRLFPAAYLETARPAGPLFQRMPLWGQFLDRHGETKEELTGPFLERLERHSDPDRLIDCFPYQVLALCALLDVFP